MTGLVPDKDRIIEIATIVTDENLEEQIEGPVIAIHQSRARMQAMDEWNTKQHGQSGLVERVIHSDVSEAQASQQTIEFLNEWVPTGVSPMCGNSICQDRRFLANYMPELEAYFHYRNLDVSTLKELARRWAPDLPPFQKTGAHLALDDIRDSIKELQHYRAHFLRI